MNNRDYEELRKENIRLKKENEVLKENQAELKQLRDENKLNNLIIDFISMSYRELNNQEDKDILTVQEKNTKIKSISSYLETLLNAHKKSQIKVSDDLINELETFINELVKISLDKYKDFPDEVTEINLTDKEK